MQQEYQEVAYVLKRFFPHRQKIALLTRLSGRINVVIKQQEMCVRLWPGMLITGDLYKDGAVWTSKKITIYSIPSALWVHHILELCYYFIPLESPCFDVFVYLKQCYSLAVKADIFAFETQEIIKKICVMKFLSMIGFYAHEEICRYTALFQELSVDFVDIANKQKVDFLENKLLLLSAHDMDLWILNCLKSHPMFKMFKTVDSQYHY